MTAPSDAERAREIVGHLRVGWSALFNTDGVELMASTVADLIALNLREVRTEERERAARIAETWADGQGASAIAKEAEDCPGSAWEHEQAARLVRMLADAIRRQEGRDA